VKFVIPFAAMALVASPAIAQEKPVFDFAGFDTETAVANPSFGRGCDVDRDEPGKTACSAWNMRLGDGSAKIVMVNLYEGKLSSALGILDRNQFLSVLSAFTAKYGSPDRTETRVWRNGAGASLDNEVFIWEFQGGELELESIGSRIRDSSFQFFHTTNRAPTEAPPVNF